MGRYKSYLMDVQNWGGGLGHFWTMSFFFFFFLTSPTLSWPVTLLLAGIVVLNPGCYLVLFWRGFKWGSYKEQHLGLGPIWITPSLILFPHPIQSITLITVSVEPMTELLNSFGFRMLLKSGFRQHSIHIPRLVKNMRCGVVPVPLLVKTSICMV